MLYKGYNVNPKIENLRVIDGLIHSEILAGNSLNSNDSKYQPPNTMLYEAKNNRHKN